jgi:hypothetical protein
MEGVSEKNSLEDRLLRRQFLRAWLGRPARPGADIPRANQHAGFGVVGLFATVVTATMMMVVMAAQRSSK